MSVRTLWGAGRERGRVWGLCWDGAGAGGIGCGYGYGYGWTWIRIWFVLSKCTRDIEGDEKCSLFFVHMSKRYRR